MSLNQSLTQTLLQFDDERIRRHFRQVGCYLRAQDVRHLPPAVQRTRALQIDRLQAYAGQGVFPRNPPQARPYRPCFIDHAGRACAVAHLLVESGQTELAQRIAANFNFADVEAMAAPELDAWAKQAGLTRAELALIQPGYPSPADSDVAPYISAGWTLMQLIIGVGLASMANIIAASLRAADFKQWLQFGLAVALTGGVAVAVVGPLSIPVAVIVVAFTAAGVAAFGKYGKTPGRLSLNLSLLAGLSLLAFAIAGGAVVYLGGHAANAAAARLNVRLPDMWMWFTLLFPPVPIGAFVLGAGSLAWYFRFRAAQERQPDPHVIPNSINS